MIATDGRHRVRLAESRAPQGELDAVESLAALLEGLHACWLLLTPDGELLRAASRIGTNECGRVKLNDLRRHLAAITRADSGIQSAVIDGVAVELYPLAVGDQRAVCAVLRAVPKVANGSDPLSLTTRERQIAEMMAAGETARGIADQLGISYHTVRRHGEKVFRKLGVRNRVGVVRALAG